MGPFVAANACSMLATPHPSMHANSLDTATASVQACHGAWRAALTALQTASYCAAKFLPYVMLAWAPSSVGLSGQNQNGG